MYKFEVYDDAMRRIALHEVKILVQGNSSPAQHFIKCVAMFVDLLNGAPGLNQLAGVLNATSSPNEPYQSVDSNLSLSMAITMFISELHQHPAFAVADIVKPSNPNHGLFLQLAGLLQAKANDKTALNKMIALIPQFKVPGIGKIVIVNELSLNEQKLHAINFPEKLIPEEYVCALTSHVMDEPCYDPVNPNIIYDKKALFAHLDKKSTNPHSNTPLTKQEVLFNGDLKKSIQEFVANAEFVFEVFPSESVVSQYETHIESINSANGIEKMKQTLANSFATGLMSKYKITLLSVFPPISDLEKAFRRAASEGNVADLKLFIMLFNVNVNCMDMTQKKTALHWVVARMEEALDKKDTQRILALQKCSELLIKKGADIEAKDNKSVSARAAYEILQPKFEEFYTTVGRRVGGSSR